MTNEQRLVGLVVRIAAYYGQKIEDGVAKMYAHDLRDLPFDQVAAAYEEYRRDDSNTRPPLPAIIRAKVCPKPPEENPELAGARIAARIWDAVGRFGWCNPTQAREYLGERAWQIAQEGGGWESVCREANESNPGTFKAQYTKLARAVIEADRFVAVQSNPAPELTDARVKGLIQTKGIA